MLHKAIVKEGECWRAPQKPNKNGYVYKSYKGVVRELHRLNHEILYGPKPEGTEYDHLCRHKWCCNPFHVEPLTHRINVLRGNAPHAKNARKTHCPYGHPLTGNNLVPSLLKVGGRTCLICSRSRATRRNKSKRKTKGVS